MPSIKHNGLIFILTKECKRGDVYLDCTHVKILIKKKIAWLRQVLAAACRTFGLCCSM